MKTILMRLRCFGIVFALLCAGAGASAAASFAKGPAFKVFAATPSSMEPGDNPMLSAVIRNVGDEVSSGTITFTYTGGPGLVVPQAPRFGTTSQRQPEFTGPITCELLAGAGVCSLTGSLSPGAQLFIEVPVEVTAESGTVTSTASVSGGGAAGVASVEHHTTVGPPGPFAFDESGIELLNGEGVPDGQAASVPAEFTTRLNFASYSPFFLFGHIMSAVQHFKDVTAHLPVGFIGNPSVVPACTAGGLLEEGPAVHISNCPIDSQVGTATVFTNGGLQIVPLYEIEPPPGSATTLGFEVSGVSVTLNAQLRSGDDGIDIVSRDTTTTLSVTGVEISVWGVPADSSHDSYRGVCLATVREGASGGSCPTSGARKAFLRMPTSCSGQPLAFGASTNSYEQPDALVQTALAGPTLRGCDLVPFAPEISVFPTDTAANSPTGVSVRVSLPQNSNPGGLGEADLKKAVVTLPEGMAINPSAADGLQACGDAELKLGEDGPSRCPDGSKIGTVLLHTPLLPNPVEGTIYLRTQNSSDPESGEMFRLAMELRDDQHGVDIKVPGYISANQRTGRLTTTFDDNPQLPFSDITLSFKSGARAPLVTPATCQVQTTEAELYSWAAPDVPVHRSSSFTLTSGADQSACPPPAPFHPGFNAGVSNVQAGGFTSFLTTFSRSDSDQSLQRVSVKLPLGLSGSLSSVALCGEAQASAGTCGPDSEIGTVTAGAGAGPTPFYVTGGKVFMTGPYEGAPFGLSIVVPAKAGPFDLGTVVVRAKVDVDPHTAQLTVTSDALPQIVSGVPVDLRLVNVTINRPGFTFNSTSCNPTSIQGTVAGGEGAVASVSNRFQVTNCGALAFEPKFSVSTSGRTSRKDGASLDAKLTYPAGSQVTQANIARVKVDLPKQLPSRLTTLQKACPAQTFEANPAACSAASRIGTATAITPILPVPLVGPVYFVSHGGEAFPDLVVVLQGYGVTVELVGSTFISKAGITSTTFQTVPDVPVGSFELKLPMGPGSALAANGSLCRGALAMPTEFVGQNGATIHRSTPITVTGCGNAISIVAHSIRGGQLSLSVRVPGAGRLTATGRGLNKASVAAKGGGTVRLTLHQKRAGKLTTKLTLNFTPRKGKRLSKTLGVKFKV